jgi:hypothetical protein
MLVKESQTSRILRALKVNGTMTNRQLNTISFRYSARINELRQEGHHIVTSRRKEGLFEYTYKPELESVDLD